MQWLEDHRRPSTCLTMNIMSLSPHPPSLLLGALSLPPHGFPLLPISSQESLLGFCSSYSMYSFCVISSLSWLWAEFLQTNVPNPHLMHWSLPYVPLPISLLVWFIDTKSQQIQSWTHHLSSKPDPPLCWMLQWMAPGPTQLLTLKLGYPLKLSLLSYQHSPIFISSNL